MYFDPCFKFPIMSFILENLSSLLHSWNLKVNYTCFYHSPWFVSAITTLWFSHCWCFNNSYVVLQFISFCVCTFLHFYLVLSRLMCIKFTFILLTIVDLFHLWTHCTSFVFMQSTNIILLWPKLLYG